MTFEEAVRSFLEPIITDIVRTTIAESPAPTVALSLEAMRDALTAADSRSISKFVDELNLDSVIDERIDNTIDGKVDDRLDYKDLATKDDVDEKIDDKFSDLDDFVKDGDIKERISMLLDEEFNDRLRDAFASAKVNINFGG